MDQMTALLATLAAKLGTTAEHLWGVLLRQAFIDGVVSLIQYAVIVALVFFYARYLKARLKSEEYFGDGETVVVVLLGVMLGVISLAMFFSLESTISAFVNPEFWALDHVLSALKPHK